MSKNTTAKDPLSKHAARDAEATKARIIEAAVEEFCRFGLQGARTESIAAKTGVTKAMIHYYFESKEKLYKDVITHIVDRRQHRAGMLALEDLPPEEALRTYFVDLMDELLKRPSMPTILIYDGLQNRGQYYREAAAASLYDPLLGIVKRGMACGAFRQDLNPQHTAINLMGIAVFYVCNRDNLRSLWPDDPELDLMDPVFFQEHAHSAIEMACQSVLAPEGDKKGTA